MKGRSRAFWVEGRDRRERYALADRGVEQM